jgi:uncharacterized membrane protein
VEGLALAGLFQIINTHVNYFDRKRLKAKVYKKIDNEVTDYMGLLL